jgi:murein endopeptidase
MATPPGLILEINIRERLSAAIAHNKAGGMLFNGQKVQESGGGNSVGHALKKAEIDVDHISTA